MNALVRTAPSAAASANAARVAYSVGRSLTAADFALQDRYVARRLLDLAPATPGVIAGLHVTPARFDSPDGVAGLQRFTIAAGSGSGPDGRTVRIAAPFTIAWADLVAVASPGVALPDGAYLLLARTVAFPMLDGPPLDPALDPTLNPLLDERQESYVEIALSAAIGAMPAGRAAADIALALNTLAATLGSGAAIGDGVPLAMVLVAGGALLTLSQAAGRMVGGAPHAALLGQSRETFAMALVEPGADPTSVAWQQAVAARFATLPAAGELPLRMLLTPAAATAACPFFPPGMAVGLRAIRASQAAHMIERAQGRAPLDMVGGVAESVTLALAIPDYRWTPGLLDLPRADPVLAADLHLAYATARAAQVALRKAWVALYGGIAVPADPVASAISFLGTPDTAATALTGVTNATLSAPPDTPAAVAAWLAPFLQAPTPPATAAAVLTQAGYGIADPEPPGADPALPQALPVASDTVLAPLVAFLPPGSAFADWAAAIMATPPDSVLLQPLIAAGLVDPLSDTATQLAAIVSLLAVPQPGDPANDDTAPGALLGLALLQMLYAALSRAALLQQSALAGHDRLLALQRMHLDVLSTSVSALAGGVPTDGSGLQFTRIIPFYKLAATATMAAPQVMEFRAQTLSAARPEPAIPIARNLAASSDARVSGVSFNFGTLLNRQTDIAAGVASQVAAISQAPPFTFQGVNYGQAAHITAGLTLLQTARSGVLALHNNPAVAALGLQLTPLDDAGQPAEAESYPWIVAAARTLLTNINEVEIHAHPIELNYYAMREALQGLDVRISAITQTVAAARDGFRAAQAHANAKAADYAAAQRLVAEESARVTAAGLARGDAIAVATGLFYARELQTSFVRAAVASLALTATTVDDLVPGCDGTHGGPPAAVQPFLDALLEVPLADWRRLRDRWSDLPDVTRLQAMGAARSQRLATWSLSENVGEGAAAADLGRLRAATRSVFEPVLRANFVAASSFAITQQAALAVLSYPDIIGLPWFGLRGYAEVLRQRIEAAAGCLFATLTALPASVRFALAAQARAGGLQPLSFTQWPLATGQGGASAATMRRLAALVNWIAGQLHDRSSAASVTGLGHLVQAMVIASAYGDPGDAVTGTIASTVPPRLGYPVRVVLNRRPPIGTVLDMVDGAGALAARVAVEDHDAFGTVARVVWQGATAMPTSAWSVAGPGARRLLT